MLPGFTADLTLSGVGHSHRVLAPRPMPNSDFAVQPQSFDLNACISLSYLPDKQCVDTCYRLQAISLTTDIILGPPDLTILFPF